MRGESPHRGTIRNQLGGVNSSARTPTPPKIHKILRTRDSSQLCSTRSALGAAARRPPPELIQKETRHQASGLYALRLGDGGESSSSAGVVKWAGMLAHCDVDEQVFSDAEGSRLRQNLVVHLPGGKNVLVRATLPVLAFLDANDAAEEAVRRARLVAHGRQLRSHGDA